MKQEIDKTLDMYPYRLMLKSGRVLPILSALTSCADVMSFILKARQEKQFVEFIIFPAGSAVAVNVCILAEEVEGLDNSLGFETVNVAEREEAEKRVLLKAAEKKGKMLVKAGKENIAKKAPKRKF